MEPMEKKVEYRAPETVFLGEAIRMTQGRNKYVADVPGSGLYYDVTAEEELRDPEL